MLCEVGKNSYSRPPGLLLVDLCRRSSMHATVDAGIQDADATSPVWKAVAWASDRLVVATQDQCSACVCFGMFMRPCW